MIRLISRKGEGWLDELEYRSNARPENLPGGKS